MSAANQDKHDIHVDGRETRDTVVTAVTPETLEELPENAELGNVTVINNEYGRGIRDIEVDSVERIEVPRNAYETSRAVWRSNVGTIENGVQGKVGIMESDVDRIEGDSQVGQNFAWGSDRLTVLGDIDLKEGSGKYTENSVFKQSHLPKVIADEVSGDLLDRQSYGGLVISDKLDVESTDGHMTTITRRDRLENGSATEEAGATEFLDLKESVEERVDEIYGIPLLNPTSIREDQELIEDAFFRKEAELQQIIDEEISSEKPVDDAAEVMSEIGRFNRADERQYAQLIDQSLRMRDSELENLSKLGESLSRLETDGMDELLGRLSNEAIRQGAENISFEQFENDEERIYGNFLGSLLKQRDTVPERSLTTPLEESVFHEGYTPIGQIAEEIYDELKDDVANLSYLADLTGSGYDLDLEELTDMVRDGEITKQEFETVLKENIEEQTEKLTEKALRESTPLEEYFHSSSLIETPSGEYHFATPPEENEIVGNLKLRDTDLEPEEAKKAIESLKKRSLLGRTRVLNIDVDDVDKLDQQAAGIARVNRQLGDALDKLDEYQTEYGVFDDIKKELDRSSNDQVVKMLTDLDATLIDRLKDTGLQEENAKYLVNHEREEYFLENKDDIKRLYGDLDSFLSKFKDQAPEELVESAGFESSYAVGSEQVYENEDQASEEAYEAGAELLRRVSHGFTRFDLDEDSRTEELEETESQLEEVKQQLSESQGRPDDELIQQKIQLEEELEYQQRKTALESEGVEYVDDPEEEDEVTEEFFKDQLEPGEMRTVLSQLSQEWMQDTETSQKMYEQSQNISVDVETDAEQLRLSAWAKSLDDMPGPVKNVPCTMPGGSRDEGTLRYMKDPATQILKVEAGEKSGVAINQMVESEDQKYLFVHSVESEDNLTSSIANTKAIKNGLEDYAEEVGAEGIIYNSHPYNTAPKDFIENLEKEFGMTEEELEVDKQGENINRYLDINFPEVEGYVQEF